MDCPYCSCESQVTNSRPRTNGSVIWRRRCCPGCTAVWTTREHVDTASTLRVVKGSKTEKFKRAVLFCSLYDCLKHRGDAPEAAEALTNTVVSCLQALQQPSIAIGLIKQTATKTLKAFDPLAAELYLATH